MTLSISLSSFIPRSSATVDVSIINTTGRIWNVPTKHFVSPEIPGCTHFDFPVFSFFIEHETQGRYLFDLGIRKDYTNLAPACYKQIEAAGWSLSVEKDVADILSEAGIPLEDIKGIIWSHWHFDHIGDPSLFPKSTNLIVGPGVTENLLPGHPKNTESQLSEDAFTGRTLQEITFDAANQTNLNLGGFRAVDYFNDGSFYLIDTPGHTLGHISALARTSPNTFLLMGGDVFHHAGEIRPSMGVPCRGLLDPNPIPSISPCPCQLFKPIHPDPANYDTEPWYTLPDVPDGKGLTYNRADAVLTQEKFQIFDADSNIFIVSAHDGGLKGVVDFFPKKATFWKENGWKEKARWQFLGDFKEGIQQHWDKRWW